MCTFGTGSSAVSGEGEHSTNTLKNCAKTAVKINVQQASEFDEFQHICSGYLEFYTNRARPVWLKNSVTSRRSAIIVAQQPAEAISTLHRAAVTPQG